MITATDPTDPTNATDPTDPTDPTPTAPSSSSRTTRPRTRPAQPSADMFRAVASRFVHCQHELVHASADVADSADWTLDGAATAAHWIAAVADVEVSTAREWIRIGRHLRILPRIDDAFGQGRLSYSKVRTLTRFATTDNEAELIDLALIHPAGALTAVLARWFLDNAGPGDVETLHRRCRAATWRNEPDGMVTFRLRLPPRDAATLTAAMQTQVMRTRPELEPDGTWPKLAQQYADTAVTLLTDGTDVTTEVVLHVRGDGCSTDDGTPIPDTVMPQLIDDAFLRAMIHDAEGRPINASARRRHPTTRQRRVVRERDRTCRDCGSTVLLEYDHVPPYETTGHTIVGELELRCSPCHRTRHRRS